MGKLFGTDGIRGKANQYPITGEVAMALGRAVTSYFHRKRKGHIPLIVIGKDTRLSCYMLEQAFASGVCSQGGKAILTGPLPTPGVAFAVRSMRADAGIMLSASHNPYYDNGIKIFDRTGHKLPDDVEEELEDLVLNPQKLQQPVEKNLGRAKRLDEILGRYIVHVKSSFDEDEDLESMRLVVDAAHGAAYKVAPMIFSELGAQVLSIGSSPNGININRNCGALHPELCAENVKEYKADLGLCLDGDGDRLIIVDEAGEVVPGDIVLGLSAKFLLDKGHLKPGDEVVGTLMTNMGLELYLKSLGLSLCRTKVGDRYIVERMKESGALLGGEPSGHLIFKSDSTTGDGLLAALKVLGMLKFYGKKMSELAQGFSLLPHQIFNVPVQNKVPFDQLPLVQEAQRQVEQELGSSGRVLLRYSGTENLARIMLEAPDATLLPVLAKKIETVIISSLK